MHKMIVCNVYTAGIIVVSFVISTLLRVGRSLLVRAIKLATDVYYCSVGPAITILLACQKRPSRSRLDKPLAQKPIRDFIWIEFYAFSFSNTFIQSFQHSFISLGLLVYHISNVTNHRCDFPISSCYLVHCTLGCGVHYYLIVLCRRH